MKLYIYKVTVEIHEDGEFKEMGERFVVAKHCAVAAEKVQEEFNVFAVDVIRITGITLNTERKGAAKLRGGE